jgi:hypothetical protein
MILLKYPFKIKGFTLLLGSLFCLLNSISLQSQTNGKQLLDTSKPILDINNTKIVKKINAVLDSNQKKINTLLFNKIDKTKSSLDSIKKNYTPTEEERPLPYEILLKKKYTLGRRAYQNTVAQYNFIFHADLELNEIIQNARLNNEEDYTELLPFYDYDLATTAKKSIDSIIYRCNANIVLHDLRNNWVDDSYLTLAKAYLFHKNFDTAGSLLQFINYSFDQKENGMDVPIGSNLRNTKGKFSIATKETESFLENRNIRNESLLWQARNYFEINSLNEGLSLLQLLKTDAVFPVRLYPFLNELLAYGYYKSELFDSAAAYLTKGIANTPDKSAKTRAYYLIAQLWDKANNYKQAYYWYKKANAEAIQPLISIYARINMILIDSKQTNTPWLTLTQSLENMAKRDRYKPYTDIIYFEMAKIAIKNDDLKKASDWLIISIKKNANGLRQKQKAFELLANISYKEDQFAISKLAYDSLTFLLKTNPQFETITARKKWMPSIANNQQILQQKDSLLYIYSLAKEDQKDYFLQWNKSQKLMEEKLKKLFLDDTIKKDKSLTPTLNSSNLNNQGNTGWGNNQFNANPFGTQNGSNAQNNLNPGQNTSSNFYFENPNLVDMGKQTFSQKWGGRPNVDQWRRKTSSGMIQQSASNLTIQNYKTESKEDSLNKKITETNLTSTAKLIVDENDKNRVQAEWNQKALAQAQIFLLELNDFEKAIPLYLKIIKTSSVDSITERAYLDMASEYIHEGNKEKADSLIQIVQQLFPKGIYVSKKNKVESKKRADKSVEDEYKEAYFLSTIGNWTALKSKETILDFQLRKTKWFAPYQFLKVKMLAQLRNDSSALILLDSIIYLNQNERIRDYAKNIIEQIKKRKETEAYLQKLNGDSVKAEVYIATAPPSLKYNAPTPSPKMNEPQVPAKQEEGIQFIKIDTEPHYIALVTRDIKEILVKEVQKSFQELNQDEFSKQKLDVTYLQFEDKIFVVWIGPFDNLNESKDYLRKVKGRLAKEIISFIPSKQYELFILGKSNIVQINNNSDLLKYKAFMENNIYK